MIGLDSPASADASRAYLHGRLGVVEARVRAAVDRRRATDPDPNDRFRGLYVSDAHVDELLTKGSRHDPRPPVDPAAELLARVEAEADAAEDRGETIRLRRLGASFELDALSLELLLVVLAPDLDARFERLYAYLNDDVSRRRATTGLALELCAGRAGAPVDRSRVGPSGALVRSGLLLVEEADRPFLTRAVRIPDRVTAHLLGDDAPDPAIVDLLVEPVAVPFGPVDAVARSIEAGTRLWYLRERPGSAGLAMAAAALQAAGLPSVVVDLERLTPTHETGGIAEMAIREARLRAGGLIAGPIDGVADRSMGLVRALAEASCPVILYGTRGWDPGWSRQVPLVHDAPVPGLDERHRVWRDALQGETGTIDDPVTATMPFRLNPEQMARAARSAAQLAVLRGAPISRSDLLAGARAQNAAGLERLARRVGPQAQWDDLVLPPGVVIQLNELTGRARHRERVLDEWGLGDRSTRGRGITALFAGDSGTGKTMSAEVVAHDLGLDLYVIDLSTVVDKYIGETEKNLDRIFAEADRVNGVLLFDEADALFGKRSEVQDARDRYANIEVAYLLQRMEQFDGLAVLTTNLRSNLDEAFLRRLDVIVDFPMPEEADRVRLWRKHLRPGAPQEADLDLEFLGRAFKLSGGNIRNICLAAAFLAASGSRSIGMTDLIRGTEREYQKLGRLTHEGEFGTYFGLLTGR